VEGIKSTPKIVKGLLTKQKKSSVTPPSQDTFTQQSETKRFTLSILPINLNHRQFSEELKKGG